MLILSWNVNFRRPKKLIAKIEAKEPDIVTLQEVSRASADDWVKRLSGIGLVDCHLTGEDVSKKRYRCLIASRWKVTPDDSGWRDDAPFPELLGRATVSVPDGGEIDVFTAHIPNGSGNGWKKIDTFHVLSAKLRGASDSPRILTGDFNEPKAFQRSGEIVTFIEETHEVGGTPGKAFIGKCGEKRPRVEWTNGVLSVLGGVSHHGLRDAYRDRRGFQWPTPVTYCTTHGNPRCFDHTFVSRHFEVLDCGYYHKWRHPLKLSDHSPMWTRLRLRKGITDLSAQSE